jgi:amino-acid N-acetyltransferase
MGRTDAAGIEIAKDAIMRQCSDLAADLTALEMPVAITNALAVHPAGVIDGVDQEFTGRIERVDEESCAHCSKPTSSRFCRRSAMTAKAPRCG